MLINYRKKWLILLYCIWGIALPVFLLGIYPSFFAIYSNLHVLWHDYLWDRNNSHWKSQYSQLIDRKRQLELQQQRMSSNTNMSEMLQQINDRVEKYNLRLLSMSPDSITTHSTYSEIPIVILVNGDYRSLGLFVQDIETSHLLLYIKSLIMNTSTSNSPISRGIYCKITALAIYPLPDSVQTDNKIRSISNDKSKNE